ncbi:toxin-antitoxin system YwqK family antitoxin [Corallococcus sp. M7]
MSSQVNEGAAVEANGGGTARRAARLALLFMGAFGMARLGQLASPEAMPRFLEAWVLGPWLWSVPPRPWGLVVSLVPWMAWALFLAVAVHGLRGRGALPASRPASVAAGLVAGLLLAGLPRLASVLAALPHARARMLKACASGIVLLQGGVALLLTSEFVTRSPRWGLAVLCVDAVLLGLQLGFLRAVWWTWRDVETAGVEAAPVVAAPAPEAARQEAGYDCPDCPAAAPLWRSEGRLGAHCDTCSGDLLTAREQEQVLTERGLRADALRRMLDEPGGRPARCASCGGACSTVVFQGVAVVPCASCGTLWMREGILHQLSRGQHGLPRASRAAPEGPPATLPSSWAGAGALALLGLAAGAFVAQRWKLDACPTGTTLRRESSPAGHVLSRCLTALESPEGPSWLRTARGQLLFREAYAKGRRDGRWSRWDREGRLLADGEYANGLEVGEWRIRDASMPEAVVFRARFSRGRLEGVVEDLALDGRVLESRTYAAGKLQGPYTHFFVSGITHVEGYYARGLRDGEWSTYDIRGNRQELSWWQEGRPLRVHGGARPLAQKDSRPEEEEEREARWESASDMVRVKRALAAQGASAPAEEEALYGGHPLEWWGQRLRLAWPRRDTADGAARYALTVRRAGLNGLRVEESVAGPSVKVGTDAAVPATGTGAQVVSQEAP